MSSLTILTLAIIAAANMAVGGCIGICGIAGFLLPMLYTGGLGFDVTYALALSFLAFIWWYCFPVLPFWSGCGMKNGKRILSLQRKLFPMEKIQHLLILPIQNLLQTIWDS